MGKYVELFPLRCVTCGARMTGVPAQVLWTCDVCGEGSYLDGNDELRAIEVNYLPAKIPEGELRWLPYWAMAGRIRITRRMADDQNGEPSSLWNVPQLFWVAAYEKVGYDVIRDCEQLMDNPPVLERGPRRTFEPVAIDIPTATWLAESVVVIIEARAPDHLLEVHFRAEFDTPSLWVLPFEEERQGERPVSQFWRGRPSPVGFIDLLSDETVEFLKELGIGRV